MTTTQLLDWYDQAREINPELRLFYTSPDKDYLFPLERTAFMDLSTGESSFDSPEFVDFLSRTSCIISFKVNIWGTNRLRDARDTIAVGQQGQVLAPLVEP